MEYFYIATLVFQNRFSVPLLHFHGLRCFVFTGTVKKRREPGGKQSYQSRTSICCHGDKYFLVSVKAIAIYLCPPNHPLEVLRFVTRFGATLGSEVVIVVFLIYINDIIVFNKSPKILFADNTDVFYSH